jgi:phenylalanyl-tRNA synthetase beta chain
LRVSLKWLREYVNIPVAPQELAARLTLAGLAVEGIHRPGVDIQNIYTGQIIKIEPHPNADKLVICKIALDEREPLQIVTGAPNVREGQVVAVAVEGASLAGGMIIKRARFRGVESRGMLCSGQELGLDPKTLPADQAYGIIILPSDTPAGLDVRSLLGLDDIILELELTPNRGDCLSMIGVAREVAALLHQPLNFNQLQVTEFPEHIEKRARVDILNPGLCRRYVARLLTNIKIGPSPLWMQERLRAAGVRPISNVVDVTNYVMMELGQPLHAFDYDTLREGRIIVRQAQEGETLISLDGTGRQLNRGMLIIADADRPVAIAGIMGGLETEVTDKTTSVLMESAYFDPISIRRTSRVLGLRSESSTRFEKGIDIEGCLRAADRAAQLLQQIQGANVLKGAIDNYPVHEAPRKISLRPARINYILGAEIPKEETVDILSRLQFHVQDTGEELLVNVPSWRVDVHLEIDLIEEVARLYGYNRIPGVLPTGLTTLGTRTPEQLLEEQIKDILVGCGLTEVVTYSFTGPEVSDLFKLPPDSPLRRTVKLQNPLSEEHSVMRTWLLPGLVEVLRCNYNRQVRSGAVFEIGRVFSPRPGLPEERPLLAAAAMGEVAGGWNRKAMTMDYYFLEGVLETLFNNIGISDPCFEPEHDNPGFHPGRTARVIAGQEELGVLGELHPDVLENLDLPVRVVVFELDLRKMASLAKGPKKHLSLPRFPGVERDIALLVPKEVPAGKVLNMIRQAGGKMLRWAHLFDVYEGEQVRTGCRSLAFALKFQADDRTLTDEEVAKRLEEVSSILVEKLGAELRSVK